MEIPLDKLKIVWVRTEGAGHSSATFVFSNAATPVKVPIATLLSPAMPELMKRLNARQVDVVNDLD